MRSTGSLKWSFLLPAFAAAGGALFLIYDLGRRLREPAGGTRGRIDHRVARCTS